MSCPAGGFASSNSTTCYAAAPGHYSHVNGSTAATPCRSGTYNSAWGATACINCPVGTFTYSQSLDVQTGVVTYTALIEATSASACVTLPTTQVVCLPGTYYTATSPFCVQCPVGYYCPLISSAVSDVSILRCANGVYAPNGGAIGADCTATSPVSNIAYATCAITRNNDGGSLDSLTLVAGAAPLNAASDLYLATATTVMHFMTSSLVIDTIGSAFTHITAIGTDRSVGGSSVVIVGDAEGGDYRGVTVLNLRDKTQMFLGTTGTPGIRRSLEVALVCWGM